MNEETKETIGILEPIALFSSSGEKMKISEQIYRILSTVPLQQEVKQESEEKLQETTEPLLPSSSPAVALNQDAIVTTETATVTTSTTTTSTTTTSTTTTSTAATALGTATTEPAVVQLSTSNQRYIAELTKTGSVGGCCKQLLGFFCKDVSLQFHQKKVICCKACCVVVFALVMVLAGLVLNGVSRAVRSKSNN